MIDVLQYCMMEVFLVLFDRGAEIHYGNEDAINGCISVEVCD